MTVWSFRTSQAIFVHVEEASPVWFGREQDTKSANITTDLPPGDIAAFSEPLFRHAKNTRLTICAS